MSNDTQREILDLLSQIRSEQNKTNARVDVMNKRIDSLYDYDDEYDFDENQNVVDQYDEFEACDEVQVVDSGDKNDGGEPPSKKHKSDGAEETTRFANMSKKFRSGEKCDSPINEHLAKNITDIFRNGISQERYRNLLKDDKLNRPENCEGLVTVQTDQMVWDILYGETKTNDSKMKNIQTVVVKSATVMSKVIDKLD